MLFLPQWPDSLPQASFSSSGHTVCFSFFILWSTTAFITYPILNIDVSELMASMQLAEISSQCCHSSTWTVTNRKTSRTLSFLVLYLFLALCWDLATTSGTRRYFVWISSTVILWDFHLSCLLWWSGLCSNIPSESWVAWNNPSWQMTWRTESLVFIYFWNSHLYQSLLIKWHWHMPTKVTFLVKKIWMQYINVK